MESRLVRRVSILVIVWCTRLAASLARPHPADLDSGSARDREDGLTRLWSLHPRDRHAAAAALIVTACGVPRSPGLRRGSAVLLALTYYCVFGALTANLGAMASCGGFPLCNGRLSLTPARLAAIHWTHRLLAYTLAGY